MNSCVQHTVKCKATKCIADKPEMKATVYLIFCSYVQAAGILTKRRSLNSEECHRLFKMRPVLAISQVSTKKGRKSFELVKFNESFYFELLPF